MLTGRLPSSLSESLQYRASPLWHMIVRLSIQPMWLCELMAVWPGGSGVRAAKASSSHSGRPPSNFSTFPLISNIIYIPSLGESSE